jgi:phosphotransacetylase
MKINTREFKNIVRNIIKEEMEKVDEYMDMPFSLLQPNNKDIERRFSKSGEDIETPKETKSLLEKLKALVSSLKRKGMTKEEIVQTLKES